jgi:DNA mismatch repair protein MutS2
MNPRTLHVLEYGKILERVSARCAFSGGQELARALLPSDDLDTVRQRLAQTAEAVRLLEQKDEVSFGGVRDVRAAADKATRRALLFAPELLEIRQTLLRARQLRTLLVRLEQGFPSLAELAYNIEPCDELINQIGRCISERGDVVDSASSKLQQVRGELRAAQERLLSTLERLVHNPDLKPYLQDTLVTQRQGRYVIPVRAEYKGSIDGIVHDQSASGATLFIEPIKVVQQNNAVREWELEEEREVRRILTELTELVADEAEYIRRNAEILAELDFIFARARYALDTDCTLPEVAGFRTVKQPLAPREGQSNGAVEPVFHPGTVLDLRRARHPLLDPATVVPVDIYLDDETFIVVVTGPNTGGKTVALKTVGLLALMAQSGLLLPADPGCKLSVFEGIYADIGDEQSIEQSLSTFSSHLTNIIELLDEADPHTLVLLDELGAGTDPDEGSALAIALLENLRDRGITTFATTHYSDLKLYAHNTPGVVNASVEFDVETLSPTYELSIGLPGRSNALTIARRLGLNPTIVDRAEAMVRPDQLEADQLLADIKRAKMEALTAAERAKVRDRQSQLLESDLRYQLASIEEARRTVIAEARSVMEAEVAELRAELDQMRRNLRATPFGGAGASGAPTHDEFLNRAQQELNRRSRQESRIERRVVMPGPAEERIAGNIEVGDRVFVPSLQAGGDVLAIYEREGEADVQLGSFRLRLPVKRLELRQKATREETPARVTLQQSSMGAESPGMELDLRGMRVDEGLDRLERYLNQAARARLPFVRIIHGRGTGAMRSAVRDALAAHPIVGSSRPGEGNEGGDGVTVVKLVTS